MSRKPYPAYKDSGIEWLGKIPKHWEVRRLKYCAALIVDKPSGEELDLPYTGLENIQSWTGRLLDNRQSVSDDSQANVFRKGDVLFGKLRPYLAKVVRATAEGICTGELLVLRPMAVNGAYLSYSMLSKDFISIVDGSTYGAKMPRANSDFVCNLPQLVPPTDEQSAISSFLDRETARIDALIEKKQRQIELLQEKRAALVSHAVTKGLDPAVPMKDSGIEWMGQIPEHWEVKRLKRLTCLRSGESITSAGIDDSGEYPVYGGNGLRGYASSYTHEGEFALIGRQGALCGCINYATGRFWASEHAVVVTPTAEVVTKWLGELLRTISLNRYSQSAAQPGLAVETIAAVPLPVPPLHEQHAIAAFLDRETAKIDALIAKVHEGIEKLKEYRTALISAAVTGKIDVREVIA